MTVKDSAAPNQTPSSALYETETLVHQDKGCPQWAPKPEVFLRLKNAME